MVDHPPPPANPQRFSASSLPVDADPAEKEFVGLLHKALAPSYVLIRRLGAGGMGTVYVARDPVLKRLVAVKVMSPELSRDPDARARFSREAQAVAAISHPNVVAVYAVGELENGLPYIVMQYVEGRSMSERIHEDGPLDVPAAKRVLGEVASALAATHKKGIIHRDIKPANILWDDEAGRALVTDFGIAAVREHSDEQGRAPIKITQTGMSVGTPAYMSPEQFLNEPITDKTDIYALGLLGYELVAGEGPYSVKSPAELMAAHMRDVPRKLSTLRADADAELETLLANCLAKDPTARPTAQYVSDHLTHGSGALLEWPPPGLEDFARRFGTAVMQLSVGALLVGIPLLGLSTMDVDDELRQSLPNADALAVFSVVGLVALMAGLYSLGRLLRMAERATRRGYSWMTIAEVACDARGDGGALIAGGREYATLSAEERSTLRTRRLASGGLKLAGALMPVLGFVIGLFVAARLNWGSGMLVLFSVGLGGMLLLLSRVETWAEAWKLRKGRKRLALARAARDKDVRLGEAWMASVGAVSAGQRVGSGPDRGAPKPYVVYAAGLVALLLVAGAGVLSFSVALTGSAFEAMFNNLGGTNWANTPDRIRRVARLERLRVPVDTSVSPMSAGEALRDMKAQTTIDWTVPRFTAYLRNASRLPPATRDSLRRAAADPGLALYRRFARARTYDFLGAATTLAKLDSTNLGAIPRTPYTGLRALTVNNIAAGIVAMGDGRTAEAELRFKEVLSAGFLMIHEGPLIDALVGAVLVERARVALTVLYEGAGRTADATLVSAASDPSDAGVSERTLRLDLRQSKVSAMRVLRNDGMIRGMRMEVLLFPLSYAACGDLKQILFGVDPRYTETLAVVRKKLVRFPSDSVLFDKFTYALERPMIDGFGDEPALVHTAVTALARVVDFLTGSKRMQSCASMLS